MENLIKEIKARKVILFVGAGASMGLGLPSWSALIDRMAIDLNFDPEIFKILGDNRYLVLAEYYKLTKGSIGPLRSWMDIEWHKDLNKVEKSEVHKLISCIKFPIIYTTNYDKMLETALAHYNGKDSYTKISEISHLRDIEESKTQLIKFHGDFDSDESIVLAESDYFERLSFETPLDIKLRSDVMGKSILFIGYSLSDINLRFILYKLTNFWKKSLTPGLRPQSYIFSNSINNIDSKIFTNWGLKVLKNDEPDNNRALIKFLKQIS